MTKTTSSSGSPVAVVMTRPRKCADKADGTNCGNKTRMAVILPVRDPDEDPYMAAVSLCGECIQDAVISLIKAAKKDGSTIFPFVHWDEVDEAILEAIQRLVAVSEPEEKTSA